MFNSADRIAQVGAKLLKGEILIAEGRSNDGLAALQLAVEAEDNLSYDEPPDWRLPSRHYFGASLYDMGRYEEARKMYEEDLV